MSNTLFKKEFFPIPAVVSQLGPFFVANAENIDEYFCDWPSRDRPGIFIAPCAHDHESFMLRRHGYALLRLLPDVKHLAKGTRELVLLAVYNVDRLARKEQILA